MALSVHVLVNDFALRSLRDTADKEYASARLAHRARLMPQLLWSSLHCLEKYTKCILVLNRVDARDLRHEVHAGLAKLETQGKFKIELSEHVKTFIRSLEDGARFRYYETSYQSEGLDLVRLDKAVWELRRYCQPLDYDIEVDGVKLNQLSNNLTRLKAAIAAEEKGTCITGGWLEDILRKPDHPARAGLVWNNLFFGKSSRRKVRIAGYQEAGNSPLYMHPEILNEVSKYIFLPAEVKTAYRELQNSRLASKPE